MNVGGMEQLTMVYAALLRRDFVGLFGTVL